MKLKKIITLSIAFCSLMTIGKVSASIDESILSSDFLDENFRKCIVDTFNEKEPDFVESGLTKSQVRRYLSQKIIELDCRSKGITSTEGIQYLTSLQKLDLGSNNISTVDVSKNTVLTYLNLSYNNLSTIDVSKNTALTNLNLDYNNLSTIDVSKNTALTELYLSDNKISTIDVSKNTALIELFLSNNNISTVDVSKNTLLGYLDLHSNKISTIDVSKNTTLTHLVLRDNKLSTVDVSKNTLLEYLDLHSNKISTIDVSKNTALINLYLSNNSFSYPTETKYGLGKLTLGEKVSFKEYLKLPQRFKTKVSYTSSNPEIATVDENGNISGVKEGTVTITLTSKDNQGNLIYEVNEVTVTKKVVPESTTEKTEVKNTEQNSVKNPETSDKGMIYGGGLTLTIGTIIAIRKKLKLLGI